MKKLLWTVWGMLLIAGIAFGMDFATEKISSGTQYAATEEESCIVQYDAPSDWEEYLFPDDEVIEVRIYMEESQFKYMDENAKNEEYVPASVIYNGIPIKNIAIRPKGNSSLSNAIKEGESGYSLSMKFNEYIDQDVYGVNEINLNNCYGDETYIRETLSYEIMGEMGLPVPATAFCDVYINDELFGVYAAIQPVDEVFLDAWFEDGTGDLYKPEGTGANLAYIDGDYDTYTGMNEKTNIDKNGEEDLVNMLDILNNGGDLKEVLNIDMILRYLAVNTAIINLDSYVGGMFHNYFLYGEDGRYMFIPWDLNETFKPFGSSGQDSIDVTELLIDEPTAGAMENYPLVEVLLSNPEYVETYHRYLKEILEGPLQMNTFTNRVEELYSLLDEHIQADPSASYERFLNALYDSGEDITDGNSNSNVREMGKESPALIDFVAARTENIAAQLAGEIPSTNGGQGNSTGRIPAVISGDGGLSGGNTMGGGKGARPEGGPPKELMGENGAGMEKQTHALSQNDNHQYFLMSIASILLILSALAIKRFRKI